MRPVCRGSGRHLVKLGRLEGEREGVLLKNAPSPIPLPLLAPATQAGDSMGPREVAGAHALQML